MRASTLALLFIASCAVAQNLGSEPACATACLSSAILSAGCALNDQACQCGTAIGAIGGYAAPCLIASCPATALGTVQSIGNQLCVDYSVSAGLTTLSSTASTMGSSSGSSRASTTSQSSGGVATTTSSSHASTGSSTMAITSTSATGSSSVKAATTTTTAASTSSSSAGAVGAYAAPVGGVLGALLGAVALL